MLVIAEIMFTIFWMIFGVAFYSFIIGIISAFFTNKDTKNSLLQKKLNSLEDLCSKLKIDGKLYEELKRATEYSANKNTYLW